MSYRLTMALGKILHDDEINKALHMDDSTDVISDINIGIIKRITDYVQKYSISMYAKEDDEKALLALYLFSKETSKPSYVALGKAVKNYSVKNNLNPNFAAIDQNMTSLNGENVYQLVAPATYSYYTPPFNIITMVVVAVVAYFIFF